MPGTIPNPFRRVERHGDAMGRERSGCRPRAASVRHVHPRLGDGHPAEHLYAPACDMQGSRSAASCKTRDLAQPGSRCLLPDVFLAEVLTDGQFKRQPQLGPLVSGKLIECDSLWYPAFMAVYP